MHRHTSNDDWNYTSIYTCDPDVKIDHIVSARERYENGEYWGEAPTDGNGNLIALCGSKIRIVKVIAHRWPDRQICWMCLEPNNEPREHTFATLKHQRQLVQSR